MFAGGVMIAVEYANFVSVNRRIVEHASRLVQKTSYQSRTIDAVSQDRLSCCQGTQSQRR